MNVLKKVGKDLEGLKEENQKNTTGEEAHNKPDQRWEALGRLLDNNRYCYHSMHTNMRRVNHLSHYLVALYKLGASEKQLDEAFHKYGLRVPLIPAIPSTSEINKDNWKSYLGKKTHYMDFVEFFMKELDTCGLREVLNSYVPLLLEGVGAQAFHGVINVGYGMEVLYLPTVAEGLALWAHTFDSYGSLEGKQANVLVHSLEDIFRVIEVIREDPKLDDKKLSSVEGFVSRQKYLRDHFASHLERYDIGFEESHKQSEGEGDEKEGGDKTGLVGLFTNLCAKLFASQGCSDFFLLHLVTGMRALKMVLKGMEASATATALALQYFWRGAMYAYVIEGRPHVSNISVDNLLLDCASSLTKKSREERKKWLRDKAIEGDDAHLAKVLFVCLQEGEESPKEEEFYWVVACKAIEGFNSHGGWTFFSPQPQPLSQT